MSFLYSCGRLLNYITHTLSLIRTDQYRNSLGVLINEENKTDSVCVCVCVCVCVRVYVCVKGNLKDT